MAQKKYKFSCPIGETLGFIAGRWKPEILWRLSDTSMRFNELRRSIEGVSQKMLTQQLKEMERDGLIQRTQYDEIPLRVEYNLTSLANSLEPIFLALITWSDQHSHSVLKAQQRYDQKNK